MTYVENKRKELKRHWPITSGLEADEKHEGRTENLIPVLGSTVLKRNRTGIK